ncbi:MAG TPA: hypothetical protein VNM22_11370 [Candidatus Limnocylindrales bacterium]|nr:hypothetical protein [Candidatus Limnocylindrales bacterium]
MQVKKGILNVFSIGVISTFLVLGIWGLQPLKAGEYEKEEYGPLLKVLPHSKITLTEGIQQATKTPETPISAKFELDDNKKLSLSVYTAEKGLGTDAEHNVLKELAGSPEEEKWNPEVEVFKDPEHLKRSAQQLTLMAISPHSLLDILHKASKDQQGIVFSITPVVENHKPQFVVLVAAQDKVVELRYDLMTGNALATKK